LLVRHGRRRLAAMDDAAFGPYLAGWCLTVDAACGG
jgi:hypothetical protein